MKKKYLIILSAIIGIGNFASADFMVTTKGGEEYYYMGNLSFEDRPGVETMIEETSLALDEVATISVLSVSAFASGDGTANNPYIITTPAELSLMSRLVNGDEKGYSSAYFTLGADIDMGNYLNWIPVGAGENNDNLLMAENNEFNGSFDGAGYSISNLYVNMTGDSGNVIAGLFGIIGANGEVSNLTLSSRIMAGAKGEGKYINIVAGGIAGVLDGGKISNCIVNGEISIDYSLPSSGTGMLGGICGLVVNGSITNCSVDVNKTAQFVANGHHPQAGGICGYGNAGEITGCSVNIEGEIYAVTNCGSIDGFVASEGVSALAGGIAGSSFGTVITACNVNVAGSILSDSLENSGDNSGSANVGGVSGFYGADVISNIDVYISGELIARGNDSGAAGGVVGSQSGGYGGSYLKVENDGRIEAYVPLENSNTLLASSSVAGSVYGAYSNPQYGSGLSDCRAIVKGLIVATHPQNASAGGLIGNSPALVRCNVEMLEGSGFEVYSGTAPAMCGGVAGNLVTGNIIGCYYIGHSEVTVSSESSDAMFGSLVGAAVGNRNNYKNIIGCYTVSYDTFVEGDKLLTGGLTGMNNAYTLFTSDFWWSDTITGYSGVAGVSSDYKLSDLSKETLEGAAKQMNSALTSYGAGRYVYSDSTGYLVINK